MIMEESNVTLSDLISSYAELTVNEKRRELGREIAELSLVIKKLLNDLAGGLNIENSIEEFNNLFDGNLTESEYLTGLYEDIINLKELLGIYLSKTALENYEEN